MHVSDMIRGYSGKEGKQIQSREFMSMVSGCMPLFLLQTLVIFCVVSCHCCCKCKEKNLAEAFDLVCVTWYFLSKNCEEEWRLRMYMCVFAFSFQTETPHTAAMVNFWIQPTGCIPLEITFFQADLIRQILFLACLTPSPGSRSSLSLF